MARTDARAAITREYIKDNDIDINSRWNLVYVSNTLHRHLHTSSYHAAVSMVILSTQFLGYAAGDKKYAIIARLVTIGALLRALSDLL